MRHAATNLSSPQDRERDRGWIHETCGHEFVFTTGEREIEGGSMRHVATNLSSPQDREREREIEGGSTRHAATNLSSPQDRERDSGWIHEMCGHEFVFTTGERER